MSTKHTPEPWAVRPRDEGDSKWGTFGGKIKDPREVDVVGSCYMGTLEKNQANAERIVDCVNACAGMEDPERHIQNLKEAIDIWEAKYNDVSIKLDECEAKIQSLQNQLYEAKLQTIRKTFFQRIKSICGK